jgi:hypothetical protein
MQVLSIFFSVSPIFASSKYPDDFFFIDAQLQRHSDFLIILIHTNFEFSSSEMCLTSKLVWTKIIRKSEWRWSWASMKKNSSGYLLRGQFEWKAKKNREYFTQNTEFSEYWNFIVDSPHFISNSERNVVKSHPLMINKV